MPKLPMVLKQYFESEPNGRPTPLADLKELLLAMNPEEREAARDELRSYGLIVDEV